MISVTCKQFNNNEFKIFIVVGEFLELSFWRENNGTSNS